MSTLIYGKKFFSITRNFIKVPRRYETGYYVLVPEIGDDLTCKYPLLKEENMLPEFNQITIEKCVAAIAKQTLDFEKGMTLLAKEVEGLENVDVFTDIFDNIEKLEAPLQLSWGIAKVLFYGNETLMPTNCYLSINKKARSSLIYKYFHKVFYNECLKALEDTSNMTDEQKQMLNKYILEWKLTGQNLNEDKKEILSNYLRLIDLKKKEFKEKVQIATKLFQHKITDYSKMQDFPVDFLKTVAVDPVHYEEGPWIINLNSKIVKIFLEYCSHSQTRWNVWQASVLRCSVYGEQELQNSGLVDSITLDRCAVAKCLGYKHFVEMSLDTKMVGNMETLQDFFDTLLAAAYPRQVEEINELRAFAHDRGFKGELNQWDLSYWMRKHKRHLYNYDEEDLSKYFSLTNVVGYTFHLVKKLFNVEIVERKNVCGWNRNVLFFDVYDLERSSSEPVGSFYFDPFAHSYEDHIYRNINTVVLISNKSDICGMKPLSSFILTVKPVEKDNQDILISFTNVKKFIGNMGQMLQQLLTRVTHMDLAGLSFVNWDATNVTMHVMSNWAYDPLLLKIISRHCETRERLDDKMIQNLIDSRNHMSGYYICQELYLSNFDLGLHSEQKSWNRIMKREWKKHFVLPRDEKDSHVCSWTKIFLEQHGASYFCNLWSRMIAADVYSAFLEDKDNQQMICQRFKDTYLALGGSVSAREVFRRFRGRDPNYTAFLKSMNLK